MQIAAKSVAWGLLALTLGACSGPPVRSDFDARARFDGLAQYAWMEPDHGQVDDPVLDSPLLASRVRRAVEAELQARGMSAVGDAEADILVTYHTSSRERVRDAGVTVGFYRRGPHSIVVGDRFGIESFQEATLMIDIIDARARRLVWRGWVSGTLHPGRWSEESVAKTVGDILSEFPPRTEPRP